MDITLQNICASSLLQQEEILAIRNQENIRRMMYTDHIITMSEHLSWIKSLLNNPTKVAFLIIVNNKTAGLISVNDIDPIHKKANLGFYLDAQFRIVSASVEFAIINFSFTELGLEKLNCEVLEGNKNALKMHHNLGLLDEGFRPENIKKPSGRLGVHYLGLSQKKWELMREKIFNKYRIVFEKYQVIISDKMNEGK